jgi:hypothetical protein
MNTNQLFYVGIALVALGALPMVLGEPSSYGIDSRDDGFFAKMSKWSVAVVGAVLGSTSTAMARDPGSRKLRSGGSLGSIKSGDGEASDPTRKIGGSLGSIKSGDGEASDPTRKIGGSLGSIKSGDGEPTDPSRTIRLK